MLNKSVQSPKSINVRASEGWKKLHLQLDVDLPVKKKKDKVLIWFIFATGLGLVSYFGLQQYQPKNDSPYKPDIESKHPSDQENAALTPAILEETESSINHGQFKQKTDLKKQLPQDVSTNPNGNRLGAHNYVHQNKVEVAENTNKKINSTATSHVPNQISISRFQPQAAKSPNGGFQQKIGSTTHEDISVIDAKKQSSTYPTIEQVAPTDQQNSDRTDQLAKPFNRQKFAINSLPQIATLSSFPKILLLPNQFIPVTRGDDMASLPLRRWHGYIQSNVDLAIKHFSGLGIAPGLGYTLNRRWQWNTQFGGSYHITNRQGIAIIKDVASINAGGGQNFSLDASKSQFSVSSGKIFLDNSNAATRFVDNNLYIAASDQVSIFHSNRVVLNVVSSLGYSMTPKWSFEAGLMGSKPLGRNDYVLQIQSQNFGNAIINNNTFTTTQFNVKGEVEPIYLHMILQSSYTMSKHIEFTLAFATPAFGSNKKSNLELADLMSDPRLQPTKSQTTALTPGSNENGGFLRMGIKYRF